MKCNLLSEILSLPSGNSASYRLPQKATDALVHVGNAGGRLVYSSSFTDSGKEFYIFCNKDESTNKIISYICVCEETLNGKDYAVLKRTWTDPKFRQRGYLAELMKYIHADMQLGILSDDEQSPEARKFWGALISKKSFDVKVLDRKENKIVDVKTVSDEEMYTNNSGDWRRFQYVIEDLNAQTEGWLIRTVGGVTKLSEQFKKDSAELMRLSWFEENDGHQ